MTWVRNVQTGAIYHTLAEASAATGQPAAAIGMRARQGDGEWERALEAGRIAVRLPKVVAGRRCPVCGTDIDGQPEQRVYCSAACRARAKAARRRDGKSLEGRVQSWGETVCPTCGKTFTRKTSRQVYCSQSCWRKAWKDGKSATAEAEALEGRRFVCAECGRPVVTKGVDGRARFCSKECERRWWRHHRARPKKDS